ncbi:hypothetical protein D7Y11_26510 [Corallococcus sp. AB018]|uniref:hypothetical protein n=1 Tax=Corallococcus sp. AB018 TaxID=2316715 RepID=UPI000F88BA49|nr:hypothetical protein [Corallococcus sp. AB018]RUO90169.1 hypothetical protein D7Y11_26510 [Corallococcus sp. AB018]
MLFYYECQHCKRVSDLFNAGEALTQPPSCNECVKKFGATPAVQKSINAYIFNCRRCAYTSGLCSADDYPTLKGARPLCPKCGKADEVFLLKPHVAKKPSRLGKRKEPGQLDPTQVNDLGLYGTEDVDTSMLEAFEQHTKKKRKLELGPQDATVYDQAFEFEDTSDSARLATSEAVYQSRKRFRRKFDTKYGALNDTSNPLKTELHGGKVVPFSTYKKKLGDSETIGKTSYPRGGSSMPTIVNAAKLIERDVTWDYRELGPNSFLRRLSALLFVIEFNGGGDTNVPVEVQSMWAAGSLFLASNNITYSDALLSALQTQTSLQTFLADIKLPKSSSGAYATKMRKIGKLHANKLPQYQREFNSGLYPSYFHYKWPYVFNALTQSLTFGSANTLGLTVANHANGFKHWTLEGAPVQAGKVYVVLPKKFGKGTGSTHFTKKDIHAEELFYPVLTALDGAGSLTSLEPAFIGGVKTPCRTCAMVLEAAANRLGDKLILPTNAFGHYWSGSGMHVPNKTFDQNDESIVFGSKAKIRDGSHALYATEMPRSPEHK